MVNQNQLDEEVRHLLDTRPHYPLGEPDAMKWAVAWRLIREQHAIDANEADDGWMCGWFANCMASSPDNAPRELVRILADHLVGV